MKIISRFDEKYDFLSNFYPHPVEYEGILYPTNEHAFQAAKTLDVKLREQVAACLTPGKAKRMGRQLPLRSDWEEVKTQVMTDVCRAKFSDPMLQEKLLATAGCYLIEGNHWGDTCWGQVDGKGENRLGEILMALRNEFSLARSIDEIVTAASVLSATGSPRDCGEKEAPTIEY